MTRTTLPEATRHELAAASMTVHGSTMISVRASDVRILLAAEQLAAEAQIALGRAGLLQARIDGALRILKGS